MKDHVTLNTEVVVVKHSAFAITGINYIKLLQFLNYNNTLQYYCFYYIFDQMQPWWEYETTFKNI